MAPAIESIFSLPLLLGICTGIGAFVLWLHICRFVRRGAELRYQSAMKLPGQFEGMPPQVKLAVLASQRKLAGQGSPVDRLFIFGMAAAFVVATAYLTLWSSGLIPAGGEEREIIELIRVSEEAERPALNAAFRVVDGSLYTSRSDYLQLSALYRQTSRVH